MWEIGDFYEMYGDDAKMVADLLEINLTTADDTQLNFYTKSFLNATIAEESRCFGLIFDYGNKKEYINGYRNRPCLL